MQKGPEREKVQIKTIPLVNEQIAAYQGQKKLPNITFWGLMETFHTYESFHQNYFLMKTSAARLRFLKEIFGDTCVDPQKFVFCDCSGKTAQNYLTKIWHFTWKVERVSERFILMAESFEKTPKLALDGVRNNIYQWHQHMGVSREIVQTIASQLLERLYPQSLGQMQAEPEQALCVLALLCLLGEDVIMRPSNQKHLSNWIEGKMHPVPFTGSQPLKNVGIYHVEDVQIDTGLLPNISCMSKRYQYQDRCGSPLRQILKEHKQNRWILLCGEPENGNGGSAVSGAGKTTSLRFLAMEEQETQAMWLPLAEIYDRRNMQDPQNLAHYIALHFQVEIEIIQAPVLLLMDGLDELINSDQLERFSDDLSRLQSQDHVSIIVSSKLPWEQLSRLNILYNWSSVWSLFLPCTIHELTVEQRKEALSGSRNEELLQVLNTPFLLSLYRQTASVPDDFRIQDKLRRWGGEHIFEEIVPTRQALFYRSLIVQILRWFESERGQETQWEMDAFILLHVLPAIAFQMLLNELANPEFDLSSGIEVNRSYLERTINGIKRAAIVGLDLFPGYYEHTDKCIRRLEKMNVGSLMNGAVPTLLSADWDRTDPCDELRFINHSLRNDLAYLRIANVFLLAYEDRLETTVEMIYVYGHTIELLPSEQVQQVAGFFRLIAPTIELEHILRHGPKSEAKNSLSRFLAGHIAATMCELIPIFRNDESISSYSWYQSMTNAYQDLEKMYDAELRQMAMERFGLAYLYGQAEYARNFRRAKKYAQAYQCAQRAIDFQSKHPDIVNSDGHHMKALILWEQIQAVLNGDSDQPGIVEGDALTFAQGLSRELTQLQEYPNMPSTMFPMLSHRQRKLLPIFSMMLQKAQLRWEIYAKENFFCDPKLEFLCTASYIAKAYSIFSVCAIGNSGMACNLLGSLLVNDCEAYENDPRLPFFRENPLLHIPIPELSYPCRFVAAFQVFSCIYHIPRGIQPYPARRLCELLLRRNVRLTDDGEPAPANGWEPFTQEELELLEQATARSMANGGKSEAYWRIRYLHDRAKQQNSSLDSAKQLLKKTWEQCSCTPKLNQPMKYPVDIISVLVILEDLLIEGPPSKETRSKRYSQEGSFLQRYGRQLSAEYKFVTGSRAQYDDIQDCLERMKRLRRDEDRIIVKDVTMRLEQEFSRDLAQF
jgi:hypothetical protein